jgi:hypothetical protein
MIPISWLLPLYLQVKEAFGSRGLYEADAFAASGLSYISLPKFNLLYGATAAWTHSEATLGVGVVALIAAGAGFLKRWRSTAHAALIFSILVALVSSSIIDHSNTSEVLTALSAWIVLPLSFGIVIKDRKPLNVLAAIVALFFVLSLGPAGNPNKGEPALAPFAFLHAFIPGLDSVRAVSRCGIVVVMGIFIASALEVSNFFKSSRLATCALSALFLLLVLVENYTPVFPLEQSAPRPAIFEALARHNKSSSAALVLPFAGEIERGSVKSWSESARLSTRYALWSTGLNTPIVNGHSGQQPKLSVELPADLSDFPSDRAFDAIGRICGVRWIVVLPALFNDWDNESFQNGLARFSKTLRLVETAPDGSMLLQIDPWIKPHEPFLARPDSEVMMEFRTFDSSECAVTISELRKTEDQGITATALERLTAGHATQAVTLKPQERPSARARVIKVESSCSVLVRCSATIKDNS